ncbi:MAG: hypothetical protein J6575_00505 [Bifidobacterium sp.]|nr:hypothetical protein [Bifidobacterium sp.]
MAEDAHKKYENKRDSYYRWLTFAIFLIVVGVGVLRVLPLQYLWISLFPICIGLILIPVSLKMKQASETLSKEIPGMEKEVKQLSQGLGQMQEKYGQALKLILSEYRHADQLNYIIEHLRNSDDSFADIAEQYEIEKHVQMIQDLHRQQIEQQQRRSDYEQRTEKLNTVDKVELMHALEEWRSRYEPIKNRNSDLRNIIRQHNENPDDVLREAQ